MKNSLAQPQSPPQQVLYFSSCNEIEVFREDEGVGFLMLFLVERLNY